MGTENPVTEVENRIPGVRFTVASTERGKRSAQVTLRCDVEDVALYEAAVAKLNGLKLFSGDMVGEVMDALGDELTTKQGELVDKDAVIVGLNNDLEDARREIDRLTRIMTNIGIDLGLGQ